MKNKYSFSGIVLFIFFLVVLFNCKKDTPKVAPTVAIVEVKTVTGTTATIKIGIVNNGGALITEQGICWSNKQNPTIKDNKVVPQAMTFTGSGNSIKAGIISETNTIPSGSPEVTISDLEPNRTYYFRAYAENTAGVGYSEQSVITTLTLEPGLTTLDLSAVTYCAANSGGNITDDGGAQITARGVCWSTSQNPTVADAKTTDGTG